MGATPFVISEIEHIAATLCKTPDLGVFLAGSTLAAHQRFHRELVMSEENQPATEEQHAERQQAELQESADIYRDLEALSSRDWQLWSICALVILVIATGLAAFVVPNFVWASIHTDPRYVPQLFFGLITLIILFNVYILEQKRKLNRARAQLLRELMESAKARETALVDPLTGVFNRRYMEEIFPREISKAMRGGTDLSLIILDVDGFKGINTKFGHFGGDQYLRDVATLLKKTFRGSDTVLRLGGDEFLIILPETSNKQAVRAAERLTWETRWWNQAGHAKYELSFSCGVATYRKGMDMKEVLDTADKDMYRVKVERKALQPPPVSDSWLIEENDDKLAPTTKKDEVH